MSVMGDSYYCHEQIQIPAHLPDILKQFTKSAIRTQPKDPLAWSYEYFRALANKEVPSVKERVEMAISSQKTDTGLTPGLLKVLHNQLGGSQRVSLCKIEEKWLALALPLERLQDIWNIGHFGDDAPWYHFFSIAATHVSPTLAGSMKLLCELLTSDCEGGPARISFELFCNLYRYLAQLDGTIPEAHQDQVITYLAFDV